MNFFNFSYPELAYQLEVLARIVLPSEILDYFNIVSVEQPFSEIRIHLDELMNLHLSEYVYFGSKGFMNPVHVTDFPIRAIMLF